jgi:hypothetical protein
MSYERLESQLQRAALGFEFPPTPDIAGAVRRRLEPAPAAPVRRLGPVGGMRRLVEGLPASLRHLTLARALLALALAASAVLLAVPSARATVFEALRVGVVRILLGEPELTEELPATATAASGAPAGGAAASGATPAASKPPDEAELAAPGTQVPQPVTLDQLAGETTLEQARRLAGFEVRLPSELGQPDRVYFQSVGPAVILVWEQAGAAGRPRLSLFILGSTALLDKFQPTVLERTEVGGETAYWTKGPYLLAIHGQRELKLDYLVQGNVLIWSEGPLTYRLESDLTLDEAVRIAESLEP